MAETGAIRIGISGWRYAGWRGVFYPPKLAQRRELEYAGSKFGTVEINGTFYSLQSPKSFREWALAVPEGFVFAVKGPRFITHMLKLRNAEQALANFCANGMLELGEKLGPVLWQFPPRMKFHREKFETFFRQLPRTHGQVARLARMHDDKLKGRVALTAKRGLAKMPVRHCVEIRDETFACEEFVELLRSHDIGLVVADTVEWPLLFDVTANFVYLRLHGSEVLYASGYESDALALWADRIAAWARGERPEVFGQARHAHGKHHHERPRDVYVYFDNDAKVRAPFDAMALEKQVAERIAQR